MSRVVKVEIENCYDCPKYQYETIEELPNGFIRGRYFCEIKNETLKCNQKDFPKFCPLIKGG